MKKQETMPTFRPTRNKNDSPRRIDQFFEETSILDTKPIAFKYWIILLSLGMAHSGDSSEILSMNFVLADDGFAEEILKGDFKTRGALLAASIFAGMTIGGLFVSKIKLLFQCVFRVTNYE